MSFDFGWFRSCKKIYIKKTNNQRQKKYHDLVFRINRPQVPQGKVCSWWWGELTTQVHKRVGLARGLWRGSTLVSTAGLSQGRPSVEGRCAWVFRVRGWGIYICYIGVLVNVTNYLLMLHCVLSQPACFALSYYLTKKIAFFWQIQVYAKVFIQTNKKIFRTKMILKKIKTVRMISICN